MNETIPIILWVTLGFVGFWILGVFFIKYLINKRVKGILDRFKGRKVLKTSPGADFFGQESLGLRQVRGNGVLILTEEELYFQMWVPNREFHIPVSSIVGVETPKSHLRKTKLKPLLKVIFNNRKNEIDSSAWLVKDLSVWREVLERFIQDKEEK